MSMPSPRICALGRIAQERCLPACGTLRFPFIIADHGANDRIVTALSPPSPEMSDVLDQSLPKGLRNLRFFLYICARIGSFKTHERSHCVLNFSL
jgi:hypothetical protein